MRRISLVGAVVAACLFAFAVAGPAVAGAKSKSKPTSKPKPVLLKSSCKLLLSDAIPATDTGITPPLTDGTQYGSVKCAGLGSGLASLGLALQDSGDITGKIAQFFGTGSVKSKYDLTQSANQPLPTPYTFGNANLTGTIKVTGGTGAYKQVTGKGTLACDTLDSVHYSCVEHLKLKLPPVATAAK